MSGTPQTDDIARGNHVVPTEWAQQLERERDEAKLASVIKLVVLAQQLERERDEAREGWREARKYLKWVHDVAESQKKWTIRTLCKEGLIKTEKQNERTN